VTRKVLPTALRQVHQHVLQPLVSPVFVPVFAPVLALVVRKLLHIVLPLLALFMRLTRCLARPLRCWALHAHTRNQLMRTVCRIVVCTAAHHNDHKTIDGEAVPCVV